MSSTFDIEASLRGIDQCRLNILATAHLKAKDSLTREQLAEYTSFIDRAGRLLRYATTPPDEDAAVQQAKAEFPLGAKASDLVDVYAAAEEQRIMGV